uniref:Uncharacterized protein n=1 Tax=Oryza punctata TaxID=4537 RepID=A0A0E0M374_ORYPU
MQIIWSSNPALPPLAAWTRGTTSTPVKTLPFHGRVEYVPDLNLWFGFTSDESPRYLAAADLSSAMDMDSQPQLVTARWKEDLLNNLPEEWKECKDSQLVYLGSGRFCILRFFHTHNQRNGGNVAVFTGVEVVPRVQATNGGSAGLELQMICHRSLYHESDGTTIDVVL